MLCGFSEQGSREASNIEERSTVLWRTNAAQIHDGTDLAGTAQTLRGLLQAARRLGRAAHLFARRLEHAAAGQAERIVYRRSVPVHIITQAAKG